MAVKASNAIRKLIHSLCNGIRREKDICDYLLDNHKDFTDEYYTKKTVEYHLNQLKREGLIHFKYDGRIIDLER
jgi:DNA-binding transcriptional ArsR family regulator